MKETRNTLDLRETAQLLASSHRGDLLIDGVMRVDDSVISVDYIEVGPSTTAVGIPDAVIVFRHWGDSYCGFTAFNSDGVTKASWVKVDGYWLELP